MPLIIYIAIALAILLISGSAAYTIPQVPGVVADATAPIAEGASDMMNYFGIAVVIGFIILSIAFGLKQTKKKKNHE